MQTIKKPEVKLALAFAVVGMLTMFLFTASDFTTRKVVESQVKTDGCYALLLKLETIISALKDAEVGSRTYAFTGDRSYLLLYQNGRDETLHQMEQLKAYVAANATKQQQVERLSINISERLDIASELANARGIDDARSTIAIETRRASMDKIRSLLNDWKAQEALAFDQALTEREKWKKFDQVADNLIGLALLGFFSALVYRTCSQISANKRSAKELQTAYDQIRAVSDHKSQFLHNISHELRTPLAGLSGMTELLLDSPCLDEDARDLAGIIHTSSDRFAEVVDDLLDLSSIEAGQIGLQRRAFAVGNVTRNAIDSVIAMAKEKNLSIAATVEPTIPQTLIGDDGRISRILLHLLHNAIKFTDKGEIRMEVSLESPLTNEVARVLFSVCDPGIGINSSAQRMIFEPFVQADGSHTRRHGGSGVGLAVCKGLATLLGGEIGVRSKAGSGSTFWFSVPLDIVRQTVGSPSR